MRLLIDRQDSFVTESRDVLRAGLQTAVDDTAARHAGKKQQEPVDFLDLLTSSVRQPLARSPPRWRIPLIESPSPRVGIKHGLADRPSCGKHGAPSGWGFAFRQRQQ
jgi:hypothetical protein